MLWPTQALQSLELHLGFSQISKWASGWEVGTFTRDNLMQGHEPKSQSHIRTCPHFFALRWEKGKKELDCFSLHFLQRYHLCADTNRNNSTFFEISIFFTGMWKTAFVCLQLTPCQWENCITISFLSRELDFCNGIICESLFPPLTLVLLYCFLWISIFLPLFPGCYS